MAKTRPAGRHRTFTGITVAALMLSGCGGGLVIDPSDWFASPGRRPAPDTLGLTVFQGAVEAPAARPVTTADLIGPDGRCHAGPEATSLALGVGLTMTECEVVAVLGAPDRFEVGTAEDGERRVVLTYPRGSHPGAYTFISGRLRVMERLAAAANPEPRRRTSR